MVPAKILRTCLTRSPQSWQVEMGQFQHTYILLGSTMCASASLGAGDYDGHFGDWNFLGVTICWPFLNMYLMIPLPEVISRCNRAETSSNSCVAICGPGRIDWKSSSFWCWKSHKSIFGSKFSPLLLEHGVHYWYSFQSKVFGAR